MPRPLRPLDPDAGPLQRFAFELRELRACAGGLTYQELASRTRFSLAALSEAARGERLPSLPVTLAYVEACGAGREEWTLRWRQVQAELAALAEDQPGRSRPPYRGLASYQPEDAALFFGRDDLLATLIDRAATHRLLTVFGPSGSGKSSLLRAGLLPAARDGKLGDIPARLITPGQRLPERPLDAGGLLIVDQFEEIYTGGHPAAERTRFIDTLLAARRPGSRAQVVLGVRADFLGHCALHGGLAEAINETSLLVGPMTAQQLRQVIVKPATHAGLGVDPELVASILHDAGDEPGTLPLLSHALLETWRLCRGKQLTLGQYTAVGGLHGAVARTAEGVYTELSQRQRAVARQVFLRLVVPRGSGDDTGRPVPREEFSGADSEVLELLIGARLLTQDGQNVRLAHEALLGSWPRLRDWVAEERDGLRLHGKLTDAAQAWDELGRDAGALYRGSRLAVTRDWARAASGREAERPPFELTALERSFLVASARAEDDERAAAARRTRRLRLLAGALAVLLLAATAAGVSAWTQRQDAVSRQLAAEATASIELDVRRATQRALDAYDHAPTAEARSALLSIAGRRPYTTRLTGHAGMVKSVAFSPDGRTLASAGEDETVRLWNVRDGTPLATLAGEPAAVRTVTYSPDGILLASGDRAGHVLLWNTTSHQRVRVLRDQPGAIDGLAFSPDGALLAAAGQGGTVVYDTATGQQRAELPGHAGPTTELTFSGRTLAIAGADGQVTLWQPDQPDQPASVATLPVSTKALYAVAISPDASTLAAAGEEGKIWLWDPWRRVPLGVLGEHTAAVRQLAFTDNGHTLISAGYDRVAALWDVDRRADTVRLTGNASSLYGVAASPDGRYIASAGEDQSVLIWDRTQMPLIGHTKRIADVAVDTSGGQLASVDQYGALLLWDVTKPDAAGVITPRIIQASDQGLYKVAYQPDGRLLATTGEDGLVRLWDPRSGAALATLTGHTEATDGVMFSPDGHHLASAGLDGRILLWDVATRSLAATFQARGLPVHAVAFSPDGRLLASGGKDRKITLWDAASHTPLAVLSGHTQDIRTVRFSPDGQLIAAAGGDGRVLLWDVAHRVQAGELTDHTAVIQAVAFSPDGRYLASGGLDRSVIIWNLATRTRWATLTGHSSVIEGLAFTPDGHQLVSASGDHTIVRWPLDPTQAAMSLATPNRP